MGQTIKLTSKRQATFPVQLCRELGVEAGDELILERKKIGTTFAWIITPPKKNIDCSWFAALNKYAKGKDHNMKSIRTSVGISLGNRQK